MAHKLILGMISLTAMLALSACSGQQNNNITEKQPTQQNVQSQEQGNQHNMDHGNMTDDMNGMDHSTMNHSSDGDIPDDVKVAVNPKFPVGSKAIIKANHMEGMDGAEATIVGAYDTTVYTVSYTPTTGGQRVTNHKWVIHEEIDDAGPTPLPVGAEVELDAEHMPGMDGAKAVIDSAEQTTVYMVDYTSTTGEKVTNHKWVTESELVAK